MDINMTRNGKELTVELIGWLDTISSPRLQEKLAGKFDDTEKIIFELGKLDYISSAGLRVFSETVYQMEGKGTVVFRNITKAVRSVFKVTGLIDAFNVE